MCGLVNSNSRILCPRLCGQGNGIKYFKAMVGHDWIRQVLTGKPFKSKVLSAS